MKKLLYLLLVPAFALAQSTNQNYTKATTYRGPGGTLPQTTVTYFDGLGRPIQKIDNAQSGTGNNIITHIEYDVYGRPVKDYLPFAAGNAALDYVSGALSQQNSYYTNPANGETTTAPFSEKLLEASPLDKVLKQAAPGDTWKMGSGHEIRFDYGTNDAEGTNAVKLFKADASWNSSSLEYTNTLSQDGNYSANTLYLTVTKDENWTAGNNHTTQEFKDKLGKVILKRTFNEGNVHETYYVYDQFGNLACVIPPLAEGAFDATTLNGLCYQYRYDKRNRLVSKKLPGKQWEFIVYDLLDRPVATGPALSPWGDGTYGVLITQYDVFGRVTQTGWRPIAISQYARGSQQIDVDGGSNPYVLGSNDILTKNYYDNYSYSGAPTLPSQIEGANVETAVKGLATGSWVRILTTATETLGELSYTLYDTKGRPVRTHTDNYLGGYTEVDSKLDFMGKTMYTITRHKRTAADTEMVTTDTFTYTQQNRLALHVHQIDGGDVQLLANNTYDALGQLTSKKVGGSATAYTSLQKVDYQYNIRGWLQSINDVNGLVSTDLDNRDDLFAFKISYNTPEDTNKALFNGNISETYWRSFNDDQLRKYEYTYDHLNRLLQADYSRPDNKNIKNAYKEKLTYDKNGNITSLIRNAFEDESYEYEVDNLIYAYDANNKNQLTKVSDSSGWSDGFNEGKDPNSDGTNDSTDYQYDTNGNMISDENKGISQIAYNHLNLPVQIVFDNDSDLRIEYLYDAKGRKVGKKVHAKETVHYPCPGGGGGESSRGSSTANLTQQCSSTSPVLEETDYLAGGYQYKFGQLEFIPHAEGFVKSKDGAFAYYFNYTDHLGNVRVTYYDDGSGMPVIEEETNYYPFGLKHKGYNEPQQYGRYWANGAVTQQSVNPFKYKYNGKEFQDELGLNITAMDWRHYDGAIARFMNIDLLSEMKYDNTPYRFAFNNPNFWIDPSGLFETRKEARAYRRSHGISGGISKQSDGTFAINDKKNNVSYAKGDDSNFTSTDKNDNDGVVESIYADLTKTTNKENNLVSTGTKYNDYTGLLLLGLEGTPGSFRLRTTLKPISPKFYTNSWKGNQHATTYSLRKIGKGLGNLGAGVGVLLDAQGVNNYYDPMYGPKSPNSVHPGKAALNTGMAAYGIWVNPMPELLYLGVDMFYPGGWTGDDKNPGLAKDQDRLNQENKAINPNWQLWPGAMKQ